MCFPQQAPPVHRPELVRPHELSIVRAAIDNAEGDQGRFAAMYAQLRQGYNFNDPPHYAPPDAARMKVS
jgi:cyanobactin biosynthesis protein (PatB/AcyB/McaB family)